MDSWKEKLKKKFYLWKPNVREGEFVTCGAEVKEFIENLLHKAIIEAKKEVLNKAILSLIEQKGCFYAKDMKSLDNVQASIRRLEQLKKQA